MLQMPLSRGEGVAALSYLFHFSAKTTRRVEEATDVVELVQPDAHSPAPSYTGSQQAFNGG